MSNGKGDRDRTADREAYRRGHDRIFGRPARREALAKVLADIDKRRELVREATQFIIDLERGVQR